ncbi:GNAT family N-acetyltransferase [Exiguobacterium sp. SH5S4]|uniref:inositol monophosphatase family protein n=1 Tax=Exiguobacterium sp. SH5S4 TaxID=2510961 RepID=UPI001039D576|nr:inositol monophosphatase family protein [Exiguobacterium sp. SH5S4]TCI27546.1 GNAT family N-acetyltransferase [Exiguobacterium sp. SH5S4]
MLEWFAIDLIKQAGEYIRQQIDESYRIERKTGKGDLVTEIDRAVEQLIVDRIRAAYPEHQIVGEEGISTQPDKLTGTVWFVDPIDGTLNFIHQKRMFAISIAIMVDEVVEYGFVYDVMADELFVARRGYGATLNGRKLPPLHEHHVRDAFLSMNATWVTPNQQIAPEVLAPIVRDSVGTRAHGAASLELAWVAAGRVDGYITMRNMPWDYAAGKLLVEEVRGRVVSLYGEPVSYKGKTSVLAGSETFVKDVIKHYVIAKNVAPEVRPDLAIEPNKTYDRVRDLLVLANPNEAMVQAQYETGSTFEALLGGELVGAYMLVRRSAESVELVNIAVKPDRQNQTIGQRMLQDAIRRAASGSASELLVCTGNSSIVQLRFYQQAGFRFASVERDYFPNHGYEAIEEDGLVLRDRICLTREL